MGIGLTKSRQEARRMIGKGVTTELHLRGKSETLHSIGMGSYTMDSHNVQRYVKKDKEEIFVLNEGDVQVRPAGPYQIFYDSVVPKAEECENLLVPVCVSSSHIAFGSIRMEPVFMILGQSAATAAVMAIEAEQTVQALDYSKLASRLTEDGQVLALKKETRESWGVGISPDKLKGVVVDGEEVEFQGEWSEKLVRSALSWALPIGMTAMEERGCGRPNFPLSRKRTVCTRSRFPSFLRVTGRVR